MIPTLEAVLKVEHDLPGGSSHPWIITAKNDGKFEEYVIKLYTEPDPLIIRELCSSVIATELEIPTPEPALIRLGSNFIDSLKGNDKERVKKLPIKIVFGNKYYEGYTDLPIAKGSSVCKNLSPEIIFAFDVLIRNFDRRKLKANLLVNGDDFYCIDHEHTLSVNKEFSTLTSKDWEMLVRNGKDCHLFYKELKNKNKLDFGGFRELFRTFSIDCLDDVSEVLLENQFEIDTLEETKMYLNDVIRNKDLFFNLLKDLISK